MNSEEKLQEVLKVALKCFARFGYKKTTMEEIAGELGLTKGALYIYASNKEDLYQKAIAMALNSWQNRVREALNKETDPIVKLRLMSFKAFQYLAEDDELRQILVTDPEIFPMFPINDPYHEINEKSREMLRTIIADGIKTGVFRSVDLQSVTWLLFSIYKLFIIDTYIVSDKEATEKLFSDAVDFVLHGLLKSSS
jgi:AcrR family transcriptional regulator